jgi:diguanylate cyclase (GGDEF)-like protein
LLRCCFRQSDAIGRLGGDEFAALVAQDAECSLEWVNSRIVREQQICNKRLNGPYQFSVSTGMVLYPSGPFPALEELIGVADGKMYEKKRGRPMPAGQV